MDSARGNDGAGETGIRQDNEPVQGGVGEPEIKIGSDERRMHVRAYNHWVSLLADRPFPTIADLNPAQIADFGPHSVLLDFSDGLENPAIQFLGTALRVECGVDHSITSIAQVPPRSLLSRLTDHYLQIIANRAPVGFEAEFVGIRGHNTFYRGILMPFSSDGAAIDYIYGVINWKEMVSSDAQAQLDAELAAAVRTAPRASDLSPVWADGPSAAPALHVSADADLSERLELARESAAAARTARSRSHAAHHRALGRAHDFARAAERAPLAYADLLAATGLAEHPRDPLGTVARLVFGAAPDDQSSARRGAAVAQASAVLSYARRRDVPEGGLARLIEALPGGVRGMVAEERAARRRARLRREPALLAERDVLARIGAADKLGLAAGEGEPVVMLGRVASDGSIEVVGASAEPLLARRVLARLR
ncbi:hypothetical protein KZ810_13900 [Sphingomonas sp. RHCKR47]|uniref:PAS domain-containing protein n=1 Tax=Sphingomonas citricola TaxID=2862498 RepID=UPI001CA4AA43|nr:hypothetical protein [Sphingomonas citricola]MBW6524595.1 hypothetical protein [Sphingomonas citricola]